MIAEARVEIRARAETLRRAAIRVAEENDRVRNLAEDRGQDVWVEKHIELSTFEAAVIANDLILLLDDTQKRQSVQEGK